MDDDNAIENFVLVDAIADTAAVERSGAPANITLRTFRPFGNHHPIVICSHVSKTAGRWQMDHGGMLSWQGSVHGLPSPICFCILTSYLFLRDEASYSCPFRPGSPQRLSSYSLWSPRRRGTRKPQYRCRLRRKHYRRTMISTLFARLPPQGTRRRNSHSRTTIWMAGELPRTTVRQYSVIESRLPKFFPPR